MSRSKSPDSFDNRLIIRIRSRDKAIQERYAALRGFQTLADFYRDLVTKDYERYPELLMQATKPRK